jgi:hypothetical protein
MKFKFSLKNPKLKKKCFGNFFIFFLFIVQIVKSENLSIKEKKYMKSYITILQCYKCLWTNEKQGNKMFTYWEGVNEQEDKQYEEKNKETDDEIPLVVGPDNVTQGLKW